MKIILYLNWLFLLPALAFSHTGINTFAISDAQDIQVSIGGSPVSSGATYNFGNVNLLSSAAPVSIEIKNIGNPEDLAVSGISITGANGSDFVLNASGLPTNLSTDATFTFTVTFTPQTSGVRSASIEINTDDPDLNPFIINLEGTGVKLNQTITFSPLSSRTYGESSFALSASSDSGLPVSFSSSNTLVATVLGNVVTIVGAGSTTITASQAGNATYNPAADVVQTLTVNKATITATADNKIRTYGAFNPTFTISYTGFLNGDDVSVLNTPPTASTTATINSSVGNYPISVSGGSDNNYDFTYVSGTLTINKATITATADNKSRTYGAANPAFTISYTGFLNSDDASVLDAPPTTSTPATINSSVGSYPISVSGGSDNNYDFTYVGGTLTINKATITATADNKIRTYGVANPTFTISYTGFLNSDDVSVLDSPPTASTAADINSSVGSYPISVSGGLDENYNFNYINGTLSINKAILSAVADDKSRTYGSSNPSFTISYSGFLNGETLSVIDTPPLASTAATVTSPVGTYPINLSGGSDGNYDIINTSGVLTISKAQLTVTATNASRSYGSSNPIFTLSYTGFVNGESVASLISTPTATTTATISSDAGTYAINASGGVSANYDFTYVQGTLTITKATIIASVTNASRVYNTANPSFTINYAGFVNGENESVLDTPPTVSTPATLLSPVGTYAITASGGADVNYSFTYVNATLTISKATPIVTWTNPSDIVYGTPLGATQLNATASVPGIFNYSPALGTVLNANAGQVLTVNFVPSDAVNYNSVSGTSVVIVVNKAPLQVTANNQTRVYGASNPALTLSYSGFVNDDNSSVLNSALIASTIATNTSPVGIYPITVSGGTDNNYNLTYTDGALSITKATVTATALDATRTYGSSNPAFSISYSGFANGEDASVLNSIPVASTAASIISNAGTYPITVSGGTDENYNFNYTSGTLTITKASITATASNASRVYGASNPAFTITYAGFLNGDNASVFDVTPVASTVANASSSAGSYPITVGGGIDNNYSFIYLSGILTITKATPIINWSNPSAITYGTALSATQLNASANVPGSFTYTPGIGTILNAGANQVLSVNFTPSDVTNYDPVNGTTVLITVNKATPIVTWNSPSAITYGTALSAAQLNATANVPGSFSYAPSSGTVLNAGASQALSVNFTPTDINNYNIVNGTTVQITVNKATPVVTWSNPAAITYGTPLSTTQLNATANVPGAFVYAPGSGTILNAGVNQALAVNFTPTDAANYNSVNGTTVFITVNKATPTVTWSNPADITYGTALSATQLNATASVPGSFVYTPAAGTLLNAGSNQTLSVNFTPTDATNYNPVNGITAQININKATPLITWVNPTAITYGTALSSTQLNASSNVPGNFTYSPTSGTLLGAGANQILSVNFTPTDQANYNSVLNVQRLITVNKATPVITWSNPASITYGTPLSSVQLNATSNVPGNFNYSPAAGTILNVGTNQTLSLDFTPTDTQNYNTINNRTVSITVTKATPIVTWTTPLPIKINQPLSATQLNATANVPGTFTYTPALGSSFATAGTYTLSVSFVPSDAANYNAVPSTQVQITVNDKDNPVISWSNPAPITYGTTLSSAQLNASASVPGTFTYSPAIGALLNAGTNQILSVTFTPSDATNYNTVNTSVPLTVNKATLTATAQNTSRIYGAANPTFTILYAGFVNGENTTVLDNLPTATCSAIAGDNAGTSFPIIPSGGLDNNYAFAYVNGTLSITKANLTARADNKSRSYGLPNPTFTISYTGFVNGDTESEITPPVATTAATVLSNVGSYPITLSGGTSTNYNFILQSGSLTINASPLIAKANDLTKTYGQSNPTLSITYTGFLNGDNVGSITPPSVSTTATSTSAVGTYPINLSGGSAINYSIILQSGTLTIEKALLTVTANDQTKTYGAANPGLTYSYSGFVNGENLSVINTAPVASTTATALSPVGNYPINVSGGSDNNYAFNYVSGTLTINKRALTATAANANRTYGAANPPFTIAYSGFVNSDDVSVIDILPAASTSATITSSVGSYPITASGGNDNNYSFNFVSGTLTISKATLSVTALSVSRPYNTSNPVFQLVYTGFLNGETATVIDTSPSATTTATISSPVGNYNITVAGGNDNNYSFTYITGTLTITKANPVITWNNPAAITYGTALSSTQLNATANMPGTFTYTPASGTVLNAGANQVLRVDFTPTDAVNYNSITGSTVLITVNKANPIITWPNPAAITYGTQLSTTQLNATASVPGSFTYNPGAGTVLNAGSNQSLSATFTPNDANNFNVITGITSQITVSKATPLVTWNAPAAITYGTPLGTTQLNASANVPGTFVYTPTLGTILNASANQTLTVNFTPTNINNYNSVNGITVQITVNKATPLITWNTPNPITYGAPLSATQLNATANTTGTFTYTPAAGTVLNAGVNQVLSVNFVPGNTNNFNIVNGTNVLITVNKATPVITWSNPQTITYGTALGDTQLNATSNVPGTFVYTPLKGAVLNAGFDQKLSVSFTPTNAINYNSVPETSVLIDVDKKKLNVKATDISRTYGADNPDLLITYTGFVNGDSELNLDSKPIAITNAFKESSAGNYPITVSGGNDNNYEFVYAEGILTIIKATLTAKADDKTKLFGTQNPPLTISYTGFVNDDDETDLDAVPLATTTAITSSPVGGYPITVSGGNDNNYSFTYTSGTLTVTPNFPPALNDFSVSALEDTPYTFTYNEFLAHFTSFAGNPIQYIKVVTIPANGKLFWKGKEVSSGAEILVENDLISNFIYLGNPEFNGTDNFKWNAFEGTFSADQPATVSISIGKVNDPPVLSNIETTSIVYSLGDPAVQVSNSIVISDVDNVFAFSAKVAITENFTKGDVLSCQPDFGSPIKAAYNPATGELELTGKDTRANYEAVFKKVLFGSPVTGEATISDKRITFVVRDSVDNSNSLSRIVSISEVFPEVSIVNAFTPNGDGVNDYWDFGNLSYYSEIQIKVYDRNSIQLFECNNDINCKWDGKFNGKELPPGPYLYTIFLNGGKRKYQGTVTILR